MILVFNFQLPLLLDAENLSHDTVFTLLMRHSDVYANSRSIIFKILTRYFYIYIDIKWWSSSVLIFAVIPGIRKIHNNESYIVA